MAKADLGTKRACLACGMRFYDFSRSPIICPGCGAEFDPEMIIKSRKGRPAAKTTSRADVDVTNDDQIEDDDSEELTNEVVDDNDDIDDNGDNGDGNDNGGHDDADDQSQART